MIKLEKTEVVGWEAAIRGMRNPMNSWERSDSKFVSDAGCYYDISGRLSPIDDESYVDDIIGDNDHNLMMKLAKGGPVHAKYRRMITVYVDVIAPLYWWKEFDTYKVGTVANSCSTMHKIHAKEFDADDFSCEQLLDRWITSNDNVNIEDRSAVDDFCCALTPYDSGCIDLIGNVYPIEVLELTIDMLNRARNLYLKTKDKRYWWQMIQLLPSSYNQKRTVMLNYEVLHNIYESRKNHKLDEWHVFCDWIEKLPYSEIITGEEKNDD